MSNENKAVQIYEASFGKVRVYFDMPQTVHRLSPSGSCLFLNEIVFHADFAENNFNESYRCGLVSLDTIRTKGIANCNSIEQVFIPSEVKLFSATGGSECNYRDD